MADVKKLQAFARTLLKELQKVNPNWKASDCAIPMEYLLDDKNFSGTTFIKTRMRLVLAEIRKSSKETYDKLNAEFKLLD